MSFWVPGCTWDPVSCRITPWSSWSPAGFHGALLQAQATLVHPKSWCVHAAKLSQPCSAQSSTHPFCGRLVSYPVSFIIKGVIAVCNWISLLFLLVDQIPPRNNQLQFSWMKAMASFASLHNYLLQPYQILCLFLNLHHTKQKIMSCPGAVQKPWLREIVDTKNDGHTHRIKSGIWVPVGQDLHKPLGHWPVLNSFWVSFLLGLESRLKSCINEKNNWHDWTRPWMHSVCWNWWTIPVYFGTVMQH